MKSLKINGELVIHNYTSKAGKPYRLACFEHKFYFVNINNKIYDSLEKVTGRLGEEIGLYNGVFYVNGKRIFV